MQLHLVSLEKVLMDFCFPEKTPLKPLSTTFSKISVFALSQGLCIFLKSINKFQLNSVSSLDMSVTVPHKEFLFFFGP